jgi:DNA (cytosine-5)-methyltransferase 1
MLRVLDLFSGIGGFSLGLKRTGGFETVAFCEIEEYPRALLAHHWPGVPIYGDIAAADFRGLGPVDMVTAGFPCQDISCAGKRAGLSGNRSGLFWHILRALRVVGCKRMLLENVATLLLRDMGDVLGAVAEVGHDAEWHCIPAAAVGAPHDRDRVWIATNAVQHVEPRQGSCVGAFGRMGRVVKSVSWDGRWQDALAKFRGVDDGIPRSVAFTDGYRNAVVPQIPEMIGRAILADERGEGCKCGKC